MINENDLNLKSVDNIIPCVLDISNEDYHSHIALSRSALWTFKDLPYKYWHKYLSGEYEGENATEAMILGSLLHTMILEPEKFDTEYVVMPKMNRTTKQGKMDYEEFLKTANGRTIVKDEHYQLGCKMLSSVYEDETARKILEGAEKEKSIFFKDEKTGLLCKARPDAWNGIIIADIKTTLDASYRAFQNDAYKNGYFLQAGMMYEATKAVGRPFKKFIFICVEKKPPYTMAMYMLDDEALQFGIDMFRKLLDRFAECKEKNEWPNYGVQTLMIPRYATFEIE